MKDWNPKKISLRSYRRRGAEDISEGRQRNIGELLAIEREKLQFGGCVVFVLREQLAASHARALQHGIGLRDDFLPVLALGLAVSATKTR